MNWQNIISKLNEAGLTQIKIAELTGASQTSISELHTGKTKNPGYSLGVALMELSSQYAQLPPSPPKAGESVPQSA